MYIGYGFRTDKAALRNSGTHRRPVIIELIDQGFIILTRPFVIG